MDNMNNNRTGFKDTVFTEDQFDTIASMFQNFGDFLMIVNLGGGILKYNPLFLTTLGYSKTELATCHFNKIFETDSGEKLDSIAALLLKSGNLLIRGAFNRRDGIKIPVESKLSHITYNGKPAIFFICHNISHYIYSQKVSEEKFRDLRKYLSGVILAIANAVEARDAYTAGHQQRVSEIARLIATEMGLSLEKIDAVRAAASIHDIGKIGIPTEILNKTNALIPVEMELIRRHTNLGFQILSTIDFPWPISAIVVQHHERVDGTGYPYGLEGDMTLTEAKIISIADVVEAMSTHRPYRPAVGIESAMEEIDTNRGILYDSDVVDACISLYNKNRLAFDHEKINRQNKMKRYF
jgi:PAS domain S-box-containing protein/putative nucleotidyltransferase with HDIG domain